MKALAHSKGNVFSSIDKDLELVSRQHVLENLCSPLRKLAAHSTITRARL